MPVGAGHAASRERETSDGTVFHNVPAISNIWPSKPSDTLMPYSPSGRA